MKNILILNDISGLGNCSMSANLPIFTKLGHYCMPVVTATYSCQTGFVKFTCQRNNALTQCVRDVLSNRTPHAVYVGFCADTELLQEAAEVVQNAGDAYLFVDPILGDNGKLYCVFDDDYVEQMKKLVRKASCISPNLTEACLLSGVDFAEVVSHKNEPAFLSYCGEVFQNFLETVGAQSAVITGVECGKYLGNIVLERGQQPRFVTNERVEICYSGTGDTFSSVLLGKLLCGSTLLSATADAASFVAKAASATQCEDRRFGVEFGRVLNEL